MLRGGVRLAGRGQQIRAMTAAAEARVLKIAVRPATGESSNDQHRES